MYTNQNKNKNYRKKFVIILQFLINIILWYLEVGILIESKIIHISNNNGTHDQHRSLTNNCWQIQTLTKFNSLPITLESMNLNECEYKSK